MLLRYLRPFTPFVPLPPSWRRGCAASSGCSSAAAVSSAAATSSGCVPPGICCCAPAGGGAAGDPAPVPVPPVPPAPVPVPPAPVPPVPACGSFPRLYPRAGAPLVCDPAQHFFSSCNDDRSFSESCASVVVFKAFMSS